MEEKNVAQIEMIEMVKRGVLSKFPLLGTTLSQLPIEEMESIGSAATDGKKIVYAPSFINNLSFEQKVFVFAHEVMHVAFDHIIRSKERNPRIWNIATDSVINQMLKAEKLPMIDDGVDIAEAIDHSAEEMYDKLLEEEKENKQKNGGQQHNQQQSGPQSGEKSDKQQGGQDEQSNQEDANNEQVGHDNHQIWKEAVKQAEEDEKKIKGRGDRFDGAGSNNSASKKEKEFAKQNKAKKQEIGEKIRQEVENASREVGYSAGGVKGGFGYIGGAIKPEITLEKALRQELEPREIDIWSRRRAGKLSDNSRLESIERDDLTKIEVLIDTSGSIEDKLLKEFLKRLKGILNKVQTMRVGCFDTKFYGFKDIKKTADIDKFEFEGRGGTDLNVAVQSFSKNRDYKDAKKIIFTDGEGSVDETAENKKMKVLWVVFDNDYFKPCCGKVINVSRKQILDFINENAERTI